MKRSTQRILTTHVGSLTRPDDLMALYAANAPDEKLQPRLRTAVGDIVRQQAECGIDVVNDGEYGKAMRSTMDFGAWWSYVYPRLEGFELREEQAKKGRGAWTPCENHDAELTEKVPLRSVIVVTDLGAVTNQAIELSVPVHDRCWRLLLLRWLLPARLKAALFSFQV